MAATAAPARADVGMSHTSYDSLMTGLRGVLSRTVIAYSDRTSPSDPRYYEDGLWVSPITNCWTCSMGPSIGAAVLSGEQPSLLPLVVASTDRAIQEHQRANGAFYGPGNSDAIQSAWFVPILGTIYLTVGDRVDPATRARWQTSIVAAADWLINAKETVWYVNGNINLSYTEALWVAWRVSGASRFKEAYEASWEFTIDPPKPRWASFGLRLQTVPSASDGSDGAGYLSESGGFDPEYTMVQLDVLASWYALSREPRALWLMNVLINGLLPRVGSTYTLDATGGSRHSLLTPFMTSALSVLVSTGSRPDLALRLPGQLARVTSEYAGAITYTHQSFYRGVGAWLSSPLLDVENASPTPTSPLAPVLQQTPRSSPASNATASVTPASPKQAQIGSVRPGSARSPGVPSATVAASATSRSGSLPVIVVAAVASQIRVSVRCGRSTCGSTRLVRHGTGRELTIRVPLVRKRIRTFLGTRVSSRIPSLSRSGPAVARRPSDDSRDSSGESALAALARRPQGG